MSVNVYICKNCLRPCEISLTLCPSCGGDTFGPPQTADESAVVTAPEAAAEQRAPEAGPPDPVLPRRGSTLPPRRPVGGAGQPPVWAATTPAPGPALAQRPVLHLYHVESRALIAVSGPGTIGREGGLRTDFFALFPHISRRHCQLDWHQATGWTVTDHGSMNGTRLDDRPVAPGEPQTLRHASVLTLADQAFAIRLSGEETR